ncbi:uncharacterized protein B0H64DRAFT_3356 [Chaetomium fimeti]|uniref:Uncharacterized protein n=1 Tax=Chaetomium fimeti TaxID=1854472 RepID=A0AAE0HP07_9PEZI|nr:hypothetical protein B0H64DRAFT_3356 [Chaetomium fimeti]
MGELGAFRGGGMPSANSGSHAQEKHASTYKVRLLSLNPPQPALSHRRVCNEAGKNANCSSPRMQQQSTTIHTHDRSPQRATHLFFLNIVPAAVAGGTGQHRFPTAFRLAVAPPLTAPPENPSGDPGRWLRSRRTPPSQPTNRKINRSRPVQTTWDDKQFFFFFFETCLRVVNLILVLLALDSLLVAAMKARTVVILLRQCYFWPRGRRGSSRKRGVGFAARCNPQPLHRGTNELRKRSGRLKCIGAR